MNKQLGFAWEVVVDDIVQHGNVNASGLEHEQSVQAKRTMSMHCVYALTARSVTIMTEAFLLTNLATLILRAVWSREL